MIKTFNLIIKDCHKWIETNSISDLSHVSKKFGGLGLNGIKLKCIIDTIEDHITQIRRNSLVDLTILSNFHIKTSSLRSASDYELRLQVEL